MVPLLVLAFLGQVAAATAFDATQATLSAPTALAEFDAAKLKGSPVRLSWGPDGGLFLRVAETDRWGNERGRNFILAPGKTEPSPVDEEPAWAATYWAWKSGPVAPGVPSLRLDVETRQQPRTAVGSTADVAENPNRSDRSQPQIAKDIASLQQQVTTTVRFKGNLVSEAVNQRLVPGLTFGWAPAPLGALAYADAKKRLVIVDREGRRLEGAGSSEILLPAWSPDGKRVAYLQKKDKKKYTLDVVTIEGK
jgi:hypothetical protein